MTGRLQGRVAIVTGAGNGVGHAIAHSLAAQGASVVVNDLGTTPTGGGMSSDAADATVAEIRAAGGVAVANYDSVADKDGCANLVRTAEEAFGPVDILIANAGAVLPGSIDATDEQFAAVINLVLGQKFWLSRLVVPGMVERGFGRIVMTTSEGARGKVGKPLFGMSMAGTIGMMKGLAHDVQGTGVTVNALAPGAATRTYHNALPALEAEYHAGRLSEESDKPKQQVDQATKTYFAADYPQIPAVAAVALSAHAAHRVAGLFKEAGVVLPELVSLSETALPAFVELGIYEVSYDNLGVALGGTAGLALDDIRAASREHVYAKALAELPAYLTAIEGRSPSNVGEAGFPATVTDVHGAAPSIFERVIGAASAESVIENLDDVPPETWTVLARHNRFPPTFANTVRYIDVEGIDDALGVVLASKEAITGLDGVEEAASVLGPVLRAKLATSLGLTNYIAAASLPVENGVLFAELVERRVVASGAATYEHLSATDWPTREGVLRVSSKFDEWATPDLVADDLGPILASTAVDDAAKRAIVGRADEYAPLGGRAGLLGLARLAVAFGIVVSFPVVEQIAANRVPAAQVIALLQPYITGASAAQLFGILRSLGGDHAQLADVGRDRPKIPNSAASIALLTAMRDRGIVVASFDPAQDPIKVNKRYK